MQRLTSRIKRARRALFASLAVVALILISAQTLPGARAQIPRDATQTTRDARRADLENRQRDLWSLERANRKPAGRVSDARPAYREVKEDFEKLQLSSYNLSGAAEPTAVLDYALIQTEAAEIRKCAARLLTSLMLPKPEKVEKQKKADDDFAIQDVRTTIASLDELVKSFVWNPVFQQSGIVDVQNSAKARRDLEGILKLSEQIRKFADAAGKNSGKN